MLSPNLRLFLTINLQQVTPNRTRSEGEELRTGVILIPRRPYYFSVPGNGAFKRLSCQTTTKLAAMRLTSHSPGGDR